MFSFKTKLSACFQFVAEHYYVPKGGGGFQKIKCHWERNNVQIHIASSFSILAEHYYVPNVGSQNIKCH